MHAGREDDSHGAQAAYERRLADAASADHDHARSAITIASSGHAMGARERFGAGASSASSATSVVIDGRTLLSFAGCNYLGLAHHPRVIAALSESLGAHGISCGASRETTGNSTAHEDLERDVARFLRTPSALLVPDGYLANLVAAQGLAPDHELVLVDERSHASIADALAAAGWRTVEYRHASASAAARELERALTTAAGREIGPVRATNRSGPRIAIFTDGVFPAHGTMAPLRELLALLPDERGTLVVDDAHATGVLGASGRGTCEHFGLDDPRVVITSTLSKALGCFGGLVAGSEERVRSIRERSRAFAGSSPIPPALARAGSAAIGELESDPSRLARLRANTARLRERFGALRLPAHELDVPVFAFALDAPERMRRVHEELLERGILAPCIRYPDGVHDRGSWFRIALSSEHTREHIDRLADALRSALGR